MTISELVFWYCTIILVLLLAFVVLLLRRKAGGKPIFTQVWHFHFGSPKEKVLTGEFWLRVLLAIFIALSLAVIISVLVLPYGTAQAVAALLITLAALVVLVPKLLD